MQITTQKQVAALLAGLFMAGAANGIVITDRVEPGNEIPELLERSHRHNLNDDDFLLGSATSATLLVEASVNAQVAAAYIESCNTTCNASLLPRPYSFILGANGGLNSDGLINLQTEVSVTGDDLNLSLNYTVDSLALAALNTAGLFDVHVINDSTGRGNFTIDRSTLTVNGELNSTVAPPVVAPPVVAPPVVAPPVVAPPVVAPPVVALPAPGTPPAAVSEPAVLSLLGLGLLAGALRRRQAA